MTYEVIPSKHVIKYLKKIKEKQLKKKFIALIYDEIALDPLNGKQKSGDLVGIWPKGFTYAGTMYRVAYTIKDDQLIVILLCGTHENFYAQLKQINR